MLAKLLKHEFKQTGRVILFVFLSVPLIALMAYLSFLTEIIPFQVISSILMVVTLIGVPIITVAYLIQRFEKNLFGTQGYLMFTLPVRSSRLYWSKIISTLCWTVASLLLSAGCLFLFVFFFSEMSGEDLNMLLSNLGVWFGSQNVLYLVIYLLFAIFTSLLSFLTVVFFSITLAHSGISQKSNNLLAFLFFIGVSVVLNLIENLSTALIPLSLQINIQMGEISLVGKNMMPMLQSTHPSQEVLLGLGNYFVMIPAIIVLTFLTIRMMRKRVNLK